MSCKQVCPQFVLSQSPSGRVRARKESRLELWQDAAAERLDWTSAGLSMRGAGGSDPAPELSFTKRLVG